MYTYRFYFSKRSRVKENLSISFVTNKKTSFSLFLFFHPKNIVLYEIKIAHNNSKAFFLSIINIIHVIVIVVLFTSIQRQNWLCAKLKLGTNFLLAKNWSLIFDKLFFLCMKIKKNVFVPFICISEQKCMKMLRYSTLIFLFCREKLIFKICK